MKKVLAILVFGCAASATNAEAAMQSGEYDFWLTGNPNPFGTVCLKDNQVWYGVTFDSAERAVKWGGYWSTGFGNSGNEIRIVGSYQSGTLIPPTHDDITVDEKTMSADWFTWSDNKNFFNDRTKFTMKLKGPCK